MTADGKDIVLGGNGVTKRFRGLTAVEKVSFRIPRGSICGLIGPNGAGKSTLFNLITGYYALTEGEIRYNGQRIDGLPTSRINRLGIARAFQIAKPFQGLTAYENVRVGALFGRDGARDPDRVARDALALAGLGEMAGLRASHLTIGHLRQLELARSIATRPELLLADEPCAGLNPAETEAVLRILRKIRDQGTTIWLVEHDMRAVMSISEYLFVIEAGALIAEGPPREVAANPRVIEAYLGQDRPWSE